MQIFQQFSPVGSSRIVADATSIEDHIDRATNVRSVPRKDPQSFMDGDLVGSIKLLSHELHHPSQFIHQRAVVAGILETVADSLIDLNDELRRLCPKHVLLLPTVANVALIAALVRAMDWPDVALPARMIFGACTTGDLPPTGVLRPRYRPATVDPATFDHRRWASVLHSSVRKRNAKLTSKRRLEAAAVYQKSVEEATPDSLGRSWSTGPLTREQVRTMFPDGCWPSRRFGVQQKGSIRPCDDNRESGLNSSAEAFETISPDTADLPAAIADVFYSLLGDQATLQGGCDDWRKAYRQIPTSDPSRSVVAVWSPEDDDVRYFVLHGHCFGQLSAVNTFNAVSKFLTCAARFLFAHAGGNYFDDHFTLEPAYVRDSGQRALGTLASRCGFLFDPDKHTDMAPSFIYLGVSHDLSRAGGGVVVVRILPQRRRDLVALCRNVLSSGSLSPGAAASLRGKLYFAASSAYGKVGRAALQPIIQRQERPGADYRLHGSMITSLKFFVTLLNNMPDREIRLGTDPRPPLIVWSDASWENMVGWLGFVVYDPESGGFLHSDSHVPDHILEMFVRRKQKIGQCEILAAIAVYFSLPDLCRDRQVIHWIDNTSAISCLVHGYSGKVDSALLVNVFNLFNAGLKARVHFEYVESKANVADLPSRQEFAFLLLRLASRPVPMVLHNAGTWEGPLRHFLSMSLPGGAPVKRVRSSKKRSRTGERERKKRAALRTCSRD